MKTFYIGKDECGDVFVYNYEPKLKGESPNRCLVSIGDEEKIYDYETGYTTFGKLMPIDYNMIDSVKPLEYKKIYITAKM